MSIMSELIKELRSAAKCYGQLNCDICTQRLLLDAADTIEALSAKLATHNLGKGEWIPCSERLPDVDVEVLTTTDWSDVLIAWLNKDDAWETEEFILNNDEILAWMPLPEAYREDGEA